MTMTHKQWLDNEYQLWAEALNASTVHNFREHPQVKRMLGEVGRMDFYNKEVSEAIIKNRELLSKIDSIGYTDQSVFFTGAFIRMVYWAQQVLKQNPKSICEIGGGVGEFYAILRALGYTGTYYIHDLDPVKEFQKKFLAEAERLTGLNLFYNDEDAARFCVSFYALGEFDDELKKWYIENIVNHCEHGLIVSNPHSGASSDMDIDHPVDIEARTDGTFKITW